MDGTKETYATSGAVTGNDHRGIGRRALLAGAGGAAVLGGGAAPAGAVALPDHAQAGAGEHPDAALLAACATFAAVEAEVGAWRAGAAMADSAGSALLARWYEALDRVTPMCPRTAEGLGAKAAVAHAAMISTAGAEGLASEEAAALAALGDVLALTGGAV